MGKRILKLDNTLPTLDEFKKTRVAAYARVSTDKDEQQNSLQAQKDYFTLLIKSNVSWEFAGIYDDGISGLTQKNRDGFNNMVEDALNEKIDLIITKSISRFARNTLDSLEILRKLKDKGVGVYFQKENINTLDGKGEFVLTLMSSFEQEESRSISEKEAELEKLANKVDEEESVDNDKKEEDKEESADNVFEGFSQEGYGGKLTVAITVDDGKIRKIEFPDNSETAGIGFEALKELSKEAIKKQSANVDAVSGSTITSAAFKEALANAMEAARLENIN